MNGLTRYVLKQTLLLTLTFTLVFSAAIWLVQSVRFIDLIVNRGLSLAVFVEITALVVPRLIEIVLPIAIFLAILFSYNRLISESELVAMRAAGLSQARLAWPAVLLGAMGTLLLFALTAYLLPAINREYKDLQFEIRNRFSSAFIQEGVFNTLSDNLTVYVRSRDREGDLGGIVIHDTRDPQRPITLFAEHGALVATTTGGRVLMVNGVRQQFDEHTGKLNILTFDSDTLELPGASDTPGARLREPAERYLHELIWPDAQSQQMYGLGIAAELHMRLVAPFAALVFAFIPLSCLLPGEFNRRGQGRRILAAVVLAMIFQVLDLGSKNLATRVPAALPLLYVDCFAPIMICAWLLLREGGWPRLLRGATATSS
ncbi:MAG TPA: LPS export ABC transporter permease LptF [Stellaceae bacterium]|nr:LPS export ABC transporter permease LptF [Stellaceae bacterium]